MLHIFVNTWGNYNTNGADGGEWITLPMDPDDLTEALDHIAATMEDNDPEWAIHDYEWTSDIEPREISEYDNIQELNEFCQELDDLEEWEAEEIAAAIEAYGYTFAEAMDRQQRGCFTFYPGQDLEEVAEEIINDCYDLPEFALRYFDYEAFARDLSFDGYTETKYGVICDS
jgi:antirestriction protein